MSTGDRRPIVATEFGFWDCDRFAGYDAAVENEPWHRVANGNSRTEIPNSSVEVSTAHERSHIRHGPHLFASCAGLDRGVRGWIHGWMDGRTDGWMDVCEPIPSAADRHVRTSAVSTASLTPGASIPARTKWCRFGLLDRVARLWWVSTRKPTELGRPILAQLPGHSIQRARLLLPGPHRRQSVHICKIPDVGPDVANYRGRIRPPPATQNDLLGSI